MGLNWYDLEARQYDPQLGRFHQIDPLADFYDDLSPYHYAYNDPINYSDPSGLCPECEENVKNPQAGQTYVSSGGATYAYTKTEAGGMEWQRFGGELPTVEVTTEGNGTSYSPISLAIGGSGLELPDGQVGKDFRSVNVDRVAARSESGGVSRDQAGRIIGEKGIEQNNIIFETITLSGAFKAGMMLFGRKTSQAAAREVLPSLDRTGKVHGVLPKIKDLSKYTKDELEILLSELKQSVQQRIRVTSRMGRDRGHGQRQGAEQDLIKSIEKYLED